MLYNCITLHFSSSQNQYSEWRQILNNIKTKSTNCIKNIHTSIFNTYHLTHTHTHTRFHPHIPIILSNPVDVLTASLAITCAPFGSATLRSPTIERSFVIVSRKGGHADGKIIITPEWQFGRIQQQSSICTNIYFVLESVRLRLSVF